MRALSRFELMITRERYGGWFPVPVSFLNGTFRAACAIFGGALIQTEVVPRGHSRMSSLLSAPFPVPTRYPHPGRDLGNPEPERGFEPLTLALQERCSDQLSYSGVSQTGV